MKSNLLVFVFLFLILLSVDAQRKWVGGQGTAWDNPLNWQPTGVPVSSDDVLLDNSNDTTDYTVTFPVQSVTIASLIIKPGEGRLIRLLLPPANTASPALIISSVSDAVVLNNGAVFQNASGLASGQSLKISGSIRINNGGKYIHQTRSAHANDVVAKLSSVEGTEEGIFEFDIPAASSTISLSNRNFGKLKLSASAYNANVAYSGGGSNPVTIRSDLEIGERVSLSIGFANVVSIKRHLLQHGGSFNMSNDNNATIVAVGGDILQIAGVITETGTAMPVLHLNGRVKQSLTFSAGVLNSITIRMENNTGAELKSPLSLPFRLELKNGSIKTSYTALLTLQTNCSLQADSLGKSYIEGPLKKEGLNSTPHFLFPVGYASNQRWLALKNATGNFIVDFRQQNPYNYSAAMSDGLHHVSSIETWTIDADPLPAASAQVELSFDNMHSGGVTDLATLRVAQLEPGVYWASRGNVSSTGTAGTAGSVTGNIISDFSGDKHLFTLGSSASEANSLPQNEVLLTAGEERNGIRFKWKTITDAAVTGFILESASGDFRFSEIKTIPVQSGVSSYSYLHYPVNKEKHFRIKVILNDAPAFYSKVVNREVEKQMSLIAGLSLVHNTLKLILTMDKNEEIAIRIHDITGRLLMMLKQAAIKGENEINVAVQKLNKGVYYITMLSKSKSAVAGFVKY